MNLVSRPKFASIECRCPQKSGECREMSVGVPRKEGVVKRGSTEGLDTVVRRADNIIHWINLYSIDCQVCFVNTYLLDSNLSIG